MIKKAQERVPKNYIIKIISQKILQKRMAVLFALIFFTIYVYLKPVIAVSKEAEVSVTLWILSFLYSHIYFMMILFFGAAYLFSNIPFLHQWTLYHMIRLGKKRWFLYQIVSMWFQALCYSGWVFLSGIIILLPRLKWSKDWGEIYIRGRKKEKKEIVKQTGIIIEEPCFLSNQSGYENLMLLYMIRNKKNRQKIDDVMKTVGLNPKDKKAVSKYSLGMKQRLAIAQAIMEEQDILILDEPFNGLDKEGMKEMRKLFQNLKSQGRTMLFASHNPQDIEYLCDTVYEIDSGRLIHKL